MSKATNPGPATPKNVTRAPGWWWWLPRFPDYLRPSEAQAARQSADALTLRDRIMGAKHEP